MTLLYSRIARTPIRTRFRAIRLSRPAITTFSTTSHRAELNEGDQGCEGVAEHYESHKQEQLKEQKEGKGKWRKETASNSEQAIKADRGEVGASEENIKKMQEETSAAFEAERKEGGS